MAPLKPHESPSAAHRPMAAHSRPSSTNCAAAHRRKGGVQRKRRNNDDTHASPGRRGRCTCTLRERRGFGQDEARPRPRGACRRGGPPVPTASQNGPKGPKLRRGPEAPEGGPKGPKLRRGPEGPEGGSKGAGGPQPHGCLRVPRRGYPASPRRHCTAGPGAPAW